MTHPLSPKKMLFQQVFKVAPSSRFTFSNEAAVEAFLDRHELAVMEGMMDAFDIIPQPYERDEDRLSFFMRRHYLTVEGPEEALRLAQRFHAEKEIVEAYLKEAHPALNCEASTSAIGAPQPFVIMGFAANALKLAEEQRQAGNKHFASILKAFEDNGLPYIWKEQPFEEETTPAGVWLAQPLLARKVQEQSR